jgi:hypothetical protein
MALVEVNWNPDRRQLRLFGIGALVILTAVALLLHWLRGLSAPWASAVIGVGLAFFVLSMVSLKLTRVVYVGLTAATFPIGTVVSFVLLASFYFLLLTPVGLFFRLIGRDSLHRRFDRDATTYWVVRRNAETSNRYFHQF